MAERRKQLKVAAEDAQLPSTRTQLFGRLIKEDFYLLVDLSLVEVLFSLPLIVALAFEYAFLTSVEVRLDTVFPIVFYMGLISAVGWAIKYIGRNACFSVMKKKVCNEGCFITPEIMRSIREGGLKSAVNGLIAGLSAFAAASGSVYLLFVSDTFLKWAAIGVLILQFILVFGMAEYFCVSENYYDLKFFAQLKNSFSFSIMSFPLTVLHFIAVIGVKFIFSLFAPWLAIVGLLVYFLGGYGLTVGAATLVGHSMFDKHINMKYYPEHVGRGLYKQNDSDISEVD